MSPIPYDDVALALCLLLIVVSAAIVRRAMFAFVLGVLFTAGFTGYCMYHQGPVEMGGILHALSGGVYGVVSFHLIRALPWPWLRERLRPGG